MLPSSHGKLSQLRLGITLSASHRLCCVFQLFSLSFLVQWETEIILISPHHSKQLMVVHTFFPPWSFISNSLPWWSVESGSLNPCFNYLSTARLRQQPRRWRSSSGPRLSRRQQSLASNFPTNFVLMMWRKFWHNTHFILRNVKMLCILD